MEYYEWFGQVMGCMADMDCDVYKEDSLKRLWNEGYDPAEAAMEMVAELEEDDC